MANFSSLLLLLGVCCLESFVVQSRSMRCNHNPDGTKLIRGVLLQPEDEVVTKRNVNTAPLRVSFVYHSTGDAPRQEEERLQRTMRKLQQKLSMLLNVNSPVTRPIILDRSCVNGSVVYRGSVRQGCQYECVNITTCGPIPIPEEHLKACVQCNSTEDPDDCYTVNNDTDGPGLNNTDMIIYYAIQNTGICAPDAGTAAYAQSCQLEAMFDRPISGVTVYCLSSVIQLSDHDLYSTAIHEVTHVLGFSNILFPYFRDENGMPRTSRLEGFPVGSTNTTFRTVEYRDWVTRHGQVPRRVTLMVTPNVIRQASLHFGCAIDSIMGVELENDGSEGTAGSHWEARVLGNEFMIGQVSFNSPVSKITLGFFHDTGWYVPNYEHAEALAWGRGAGCRFLHGSCLEHINNQISRNVTLNPFCNVLRDVPGSYMTCSVDRDLFTVCNLADLNFTLSAENQYFTSGSNFNASTVNVSRIGGLAPSYDFCPFHQPHALSPSCSNSGDIPQQNIKGETYGIGSRCFEHGRGWSRIDRNGERVSEIRSVGCYQYACSSDGVEIKFFNQSYLCECEGEELVIDTVWDNFRYQGSFICPSCNDICFDSLSNCTNSTDRAPCPGKVTSTYDNTGIPSTVLSPSTTEGVSSQTSSSSSSSSTAGTVTSSVTASHQTSTGRASPTTGTVGPAGQGVRTTSGTVPHDQLGLGIPLFLCLNIVIIILMAIMS